MDEPDQSQGDQSEGTAIVVPGNMETLKQSISCGHGRDDFERTYW